MADAISFFQTKSYGEKFPFLDLLYEEDFFLPVRIYDAEVTVISGASDSLNIFEETILELLGVFSKTEEDIAKKSCLEKDFVVAVCNSLASNGYIDKSNVLTDKGKNFLKGGNAENLEQLRLRLVMIPRTGELLPFLLKEQDEALLQGDPEGGGKRFQIEFGATGSGKQERVSGFILGRNFKSASRPKRYEVRRLIRYYNQQHAEKIVMPKDGAISLTEQGTFAYLHLKCGVQRGLVDEILVSDGMKEINPILVTHLKTYYAHAMENFQKKATCVQSDSEDGEGQSSRKNMKRQHENVLNAWEGLKEISAVDDPDAQEKQEQQVKLNITALYTATEHALHDFLQKFPDTGKELRVFAKQSIKENEREIKRLAEAQGLDVRNAHTVLSRFDSCRIRRYQKSGVPDFYVVLPLVIAVSYHQSSMQLRILAHRRKKFLADMETLSASKELRHASEEERNWTVVYPGLKKTVAALIHILLPECAIDGRRVEKVHRDISQEKLNAIVSVRETLGPYMWDNLPNSLRDDLLQVAPCYHGQQLVTPVEMANLLYRIMEGYLKTRLQDMQPDKKEKKEEMIAAIESTIPTTLPAALYHVNDHMIQAVWGNGRASLGAYALAFFSCLPEERLKRACEKMDVFALIGKIIELRAHGNHVTLNITMHEEEECALRDQVFECLKEMEKL